MVGKRRGALPVDGGQHDRRVLSQSTRPEGGVRGSGVRRAGSRADGEASLMGQATLMEEAATTGRVAGDAGDLELLRRHEPLLRFTHGELFYPDGCRGVRRATATCSRGRLSVTRPSSSRPVPSISTGWRPPATHRRVTRSSSGSCQSRSGRSSSRGGGTAPADRTFRRPGGSRGSGSWPVSSTPASSRRCCCVAACRVARPPPLHCASRGSAAAIPASCTTAGWSAKADGSSSTTCSCTR